MFERGSRLLPVLVAATGVASGYYAFKTPLQDAAREVQGRAAQDKIKSPAQKVETEVKDALASQPTQPTTSSSTPP